MMNSNFEELIGSLLTGKEMTGDLLRLIGDSIIERKLSPFGFKLVISNENLDLYKAIPYR